MTTTCEVCMIREATFFTLRGGFLVCPACAPDSGRVGLATVFWVCAVLLLVVGVLVGLAF